MNMSIHVRNLVALALLASLAACATLPPPDPVRAGTLHEEALRQASIGNYALAVTSYDEAIRYNPQNSVLYLQRGEILEAIQQFAEAVKTYQTALKRLPSEHSDREKVYYRLGLDQAETNDVRGATSSLAGIVETSPRKDLEGMIALQQGDPDAALLLFNDALKSAVDSEQQALIYYHASRAHFAKRNLVEANNALFHAVNNARGLALKNHIRIFFDQIR